MIIEKQKYKGIEIEVGVFKESMHFYASSVIASNSTDTADECLSVTKKEIDEWFSCIPTNYAELAESIDNTCTVWTWYEDCSVDPIPLQMLIENFMLARGWKANELQTL